MTIKFKAKMQMVNLGFIYSQHTVWHICSKIFLKCWYVWLKVITSLFSYFPEKKARFYGLLGLKLFDLVIWVLVVGGKCFHRVKKEIKYGGY